MAFSQTPSREVPAQWLQQLLQRNSEPPRLYAWTPGNLSVASSRAWQLDKEKQEHDDELERRRIYVLGIGNLGRLFASSLAKQARRPPITLVIHRKKLLEQWATNPGIEMIRLGESEKLTEFDIEWWTDQKPLVGSVKEPAFGSRITNLVVSTKASDCMTQVDKLRRYLDGSSTIAFVQNGMCKLWPPAGDAYVEARFPQGSSPNWIACVTTHGVTSLGPFRSLHASLANVLVGPVMVSDRGASEADYLLKQIVAAPDLAGRQITRRDLWVAQLEKLVVNSIINPLTTILRCKNGDVFVEEEDSLPAIINSLVDEASLLLRALVLDPSIDDILRDGKGAPLQTTRAELLERFSSSRLRAMLYEVAAKVSENTSSMLQDVRAGRETEINEFNGWLLETAKYLGLGPALPTHEKLISLVKSKVALKRNELHGHFHGSGR
ncbi:hypothetical protein DL762_006754 [Monosporascus cannonballus]|uniref:2-dehydropantoate 2-reductase n=1 Tax=Monosporascus cannonballus TaxID=155416 RepID=A0ABY0H215_9PEZI|nr:hypothetical protein DL762_006754 [Monosporascus cannonballus]